MQFTELAEAPLGLTRDEIVRLIERRQPRSVLEVGDGLGIHLILLACRFPQIAIAGVELTHAGYHAARTLQQRWPKNGVSANRSCVAPGTGSWRRP